MEEAIGRTILLYRKRTTYGAVGVSARESCRILQVVRLQKIELHGKQVDAVCFEYGGGWNQLLPALSKHTAYNVGIVQE